MKAKKYETMNEVAKIFCQATKEVLDASTGTSTKHSITVQKVPSIHLKPDIGCFVQFSGDYSGLMIMNYTGDAALELYRTSMMSMGFPEEELESEFTADDVVNSAGEFVNQIVGKARQLIEKNFGLHATNNQPKAITITSAINLSIATQLHRPKCRKISFRTAEGKSFYIEISLEETEFIQLFPSEVTVDDYDIDAIMSQHASNSEVDAGGSAAVDDDEMDIEAIMAQAKGE